MLKDFNSRVERDTAIWYYQAWRGSNQRWKFVECGLAGNYNNHVKSTQCALPHLALAPTMGEKVQQKNLRHRQMNLNGR